MTQGGKVGEDQKANDIRPGVVINWIKANLEDFSQFPEYEKKRVLTTLIHAKVAQKSPADLVRKITGVLADLNTFEIEEIIETLSNDDVLSERIEEALQTFKKEEKRGNLLMFL